LGGFASPGGLWRSDGTEAGTVLVKRIVSFGWPADVNGTLYFAGGGSDATGFHAGLWRSDGTPAGTTIVSESPDLGLLHHLTNISGTLYFISDTVPSGSAVDSELWRSDGTQAGTTMVKDFNHPGGTTSPSDLTDVNGILYFLASDGELWRSDGTEAGTTLVKRATGGLSFTAVKGIIYISAGGALWRSDGTPQGTTLVKGALSPQSLTAAKGTLYFVGTDKRHGQELWRSDGTRKGTRMVRNIRPGSASSQPLYLTNVNGTLYFTAKDGRHGRELWRAGPRPCNMAKGKCKKG
jgi:ELWxxDGT repeat protein